MKYSKKWSIWKKNVCCFQSWPSHHFFPTGALFPQTISEVVTIHQQCLYKLKCNLMDVAELQIAAMCKYCYLFLLGNSPDWLPLQAYSSPPCFILLCFCIIWLRNIRARKGSILFQVILLPSTVLLQCQQDVWRLSVIFWLPNTWTTGIVFFLLLC